MIGRKLTERESGGGTTAQGGTSSSFSWREEMDYQVQPREFSELKTGGHEHDLLVEAFVYKKGT